MCRSPDHADEWVEMANFPQPRCPECEAGDLVTISMTAGGNDLSFTTCNMCEAKWWYKDGELVPLASVIGVVSSNV
jgi:DNA polymerase III alpha subunit (gram-positive type)